VISPDLIALPELLVETITYSLKGDAL
jgi:hypothetical protein